MLSLVRSKSIQKLNTCTCVYSTRVLTALDSLGFGDYRAEAEAVLKDCKQVAKQRRRGSTRLENLGIPEAELLRQQQELFAQVDSLY